MKNIFDFLRLHLKKSHLIDKKEEKHQKIQVSNPDDYRSPITAGYRRYRQSDPDKDVPPRVQEVSIPPKPLPFQEGSTNGSPFFPFRLKPSRNLFGREYPEPVSESEESEENLPLDPITDEVIDDSIQTLITRTIQWLTEDSSISFGWYGLLCLFFFYSFGSVCYKPASF